MKIIRQKNGKSQLEGKFSKKNSFSTIFWHIAFLVGDKNAVHFPNVVVIIGAILFFYPKLNRTHKHTLYHLSPVLQTAHRFPPTAKDAARVIRNTFIARELHNQAKTFC